MGGSGSFVGDNRSRWLALADGNPRVGYATFP